MLPKIDIYLSFHDSASCNHSPKSCDWDVWVELPIKLGNETLPSHFFDRILNNSSKVPNTKEAENY